VIKCGAMPGFTRRQLCAGTAVIGAVWGLGACDPAAGGPPQTLAGFTALLGSDFLVRGQALTLAAIRVHRPPVRSPQPRGEAFTLVFQPRTAMALEQGSYQASHPTMGTLSLFLVPRRGGGRAPAGFAASYCRL
jgi:hypothetical protein